MKRLERKTAFANLQTVGKGSSEHNARALRLSKRKLQPLSRANFGRCPANRAPPCRIAREMPQNFRQNSRQLRCERIKGFFTAALIGIRSPDALHNDANAFAASITPSSSDQFIAMQNRNRRINAFVSRQRQTN
jgi:hypothetical protein